jgi:1,4-alpha-glucan branching enzyme
LIPLKSNGELPIKHNTKIKINMVLANGRREDRNPVWSRYLIQNKESFLHDTVFWNPEEAYVWENPGFMLRPKSLKIYEAHVGMSSVEPKVSTYREFANNILPRIKAAGYTAIQLMAIMEHAYYGSFGYHVTNLFAIASRSGTPDDLKYLIDTAHGMGIYVIMDIIHSHASSNVLDGINLFDGTDYLYFHGGSKGFHKLWDSRLFNYKNWETLRLLTSNCAWYMDEYHFDGFRFDGVTSILYTHHGINHSFVGGLNEYYNDSVDLDGEVYLMLANYLIHTKNPNATTIAEDVSGMPTLCRPIEEGGFGFDYRLNMSVPDKWIELLKELKDEQWNMGNIVFTLTNRRYNEKHITYCESHDQSIVGDKTISMWLFDKEIYYNMSSNHKPTIVVDRGMALHKMIRLITFSLGGEAYMNFIGNEFGHPEWVDFPRPGNNYSYHYCRRQWNLCDDKNLRFQYLFEFDKYMNQLDSIFGILSSKHQYITLMHEKDKLIVFEKGDLVFIFNFHPYQSFEHYRIGTRWASEHKIILDTDESRFGGINRLIYGHQNKFPIIKEKWMNRPNYIQLYIPSRTGIVLLAEENFDKYDFTTLNN